MPTFNFTALTPDEVLFLFAAHMRLARTPETLDAATVQDIGDILKLISKCTDLSGMTGAQVLDTVDPFYVALADWIDNSNLEK